MYGSETADVYNNVYHSVTDSLVMNRPPPNSNDNPNPTSPLQVSEAALGMRGSCRPLVQGQMAVLDVQALPPWQSCTDLSYPPLLSYPSTPPGHGPCPVALLRPPVLIVLPLVAPMLELRTFATALR